MIHFDTSCHLRVLKLSLSLVTTGLVWNGLELAKHCACFSQVMASSIQNDSRIDHELFLSRIQLIPFSRCSRFFCDCVKALIPHFHQIGQILLRLPLYVFPSFRYNFYTGIPCSAPCPRHACSQMVCLLQVSIFNCLFSILSNLGTVDFYNGIAFI